MHYREHGIALIDEDFSGVLSQLPAALYELIQKSAFEGVNEITAGGRPAPANIRFVFLIYEGADVWSSFTIIVQPSGLEIKAKAMDGAPNTRSKLVTAPHVGDQGTIKVMLWLSEEKDLRWLEKTVTADQALVDAMYACVPDTQKFLPPRLLPKPTVREKIRKIWDATFRKLVNSK